MNPNNQSQKIVFSALSNSLLDAGSILINERASALKAQGKDITVLSLGEAFFNIPMFNWKELDFQKGYHYSDSMGMSSLRNKILDYYNETLHSEIRSSKNILISAGSKLAIYLSMLVLINPGDEILVQEPYWLSYPEQAKLSGGVIKRIPFKFLGKNLEKFYSAKTRMLILNNPNNPAGYLYDREELELIYKQCLERNIFLLVDEAYSEFCVEGNFYSAARLNGDLKNLIIINSLSKNLGMSGWRLGYLIADKKLVAKMLQVSQHLLTCAPTILQQYCSHFFDKILMSAKNEIKKTMATRKIIEERLNSIGLKHLNGEATFYFFVDISDSGLDGDSFAQKLLEEDLISTVPGSCYGESTKNFIRISFGSEPIKRVLNALEKIQAKMLNG
ncbi:pyridoxal phosphate-dependent aminotransferase [Polynucleobacter sp. AP-Sanab-80-C2]|uniref:pyridoxal phosphate-dependent aminotransferase n=1 Tax=Polynucleobacter sp. AP-Sanab-80-C2 TaxID=3108274 RepID=UPI002B235CE4|nr:pyridoxal phosphate-dependent aminotransferase [Polynucleobacter sp. AP-Sanab-80-C2]MEA9598560.1 pyridoxal phosphate-dependent aminotransferase [Polynucleobacter sp. AP-Sanab-80-C2]